jgi:hypothetical protein
MAFEVEDVHDAFPYWLVFKCLALSGTAAPSFIRLLMPSDAHQPKKARNAQPT